MSERCVLCGEDTNVDVLDDFAYVVLDRDFVDWKSGDTVGPLCIDCLLDLKVQGLGEVKGRKNV